MERQKTSDDIHVVTGTARWSLVPNSWLLGVAHNHSEFRRDGPDAYVDSTSLNLEKNWILEAEKSRVLLSLGWIHLDSSLKSKNEVIGQFKYENKWDELSYWVSTERLALMSQTRATAVVGGHVLESNVSVGANYLLTPDWKISLNLKSALLTDDNRYFSHDSAIMYKVVSSGWPWVWAGYGYGTIRSKDFGVGYWSPMHFYAHGPRLDSQFPLFNDFSAILALNINYYNEDGTRGDGYYFVTGLQWGKYDQTNVRVSYNKIKSGQSQSPWIYEGFYLTCTVLHF